jgi:mediator of RNA polymerase II transcription subunit 31
VELEFVQCLANPGYLHFLAKQGMFESVEFKNYLKYLLYWKGPEYVKYIKYPECLFFLELIQQDELHENLKNKNFISLISQQQLLHWKYYLKNRTKNDDEDDVDEEEEEEDLENIEECKLNPSSYIDKDFTNNIKQVYLFFVK